MKENKLSILYYIAFSICVFLRLATSSTLINLSKEANRAITLLAIIIFILKFILENHKIKEYIVAFILSIVFIYIYIKTDISFFLIGYISIICAKNIDIRKIFKIDITLKIIFLLSHTLIYANDYLYNYEKVASTMFYSIKKGYSHTLYFANPNTVGLLLIWLIVEILYLKKKIKIKDLLIGLIILLIGYIITKSRTALFAYLVYMTLHFINNKKIIDILHRYTFLLLTLLSFYIVKFLSINSIQYIILNGLLSNRLDYSIKAFSVTNMHFFPNILPDNFFEYFVIDNFYVRCFIFYGLISLILILIPQLLIPKKGYEKEKKLSILLNIYIFFEAVTMNIGYTPVYIALADIIYNKKKNSKKG